MDIRQHLKEKLKNSKVVDPFDLLFDELDHLEDEVNKHAKKVEAYEAPWLLINYEEAESSKGCFDGDDYLFKYMDGSIHSGKYFCKLNNLLGEHIGEFTCKNNGHATWPDQDLSEAHIRSIHSSGIPTHYRPIPKGWRVEA